MSSFIRLTRRLHIGTGVAGFTKYVPFSLVLCEHISSKKQQTPNPDAQAP
jgi:hypothetical protein